jgi:enoyl-CoA hydratase
VAAESSVFGVFCRRFGVPLIDLGTIRLPRLIGASRAMDLILTGRPVAAQEAHDIGLANYLTPNGGALDKALEIAAQLSAFPQLCMRNDRLSAIGQWSLDWDQATVAEVALGMAVLRSGASQEGAARFAAGEGRGGKF